MPLEKVFNAMASTLVPAGILPDRMGIKAGEGLFRVREGRRLRKFEGLFGFKSYRAVHVFQLRRGDDALPNQLALQSSYRLLLLPLLEFLFRAVADIVVVERAAVFAPSICRELNENRSSPRPNSRNGLARRVEYKLGVVPIAVQHFYPQTSHHFMNLAAGWLAHAQRRINRIEIVLAYEQDGQLLQCREIRRLEKSPRLHDSITQKNAADLIRMAHFDGVGQADSYRDGSAYDSRTSLETDRLVNQVHRTAFSAPAACDLSIYLAIHCFQMASLAQVMCVRAMPAYRNIIFAQRKPYRCSYRFLANGKVRRAAHLSFAISLRDRFLDQAYSLHLIENFLRAASCHGMNQ